MYTVKQIADANFMTTDAVHQWIRRGILKAKKIDGRLYVDQADYDAFVINNPKYNTIDEGEGEKTKETVDHPAHYNREGAMECLDEMILLYGEEATMHFCLLSAHKYRYRAGEKGGIEDMQKSDWYLKKYSELKALREELPY